MIDALAIVGALAILAAIVIGVRLFVALIHGERGR